MSFIQTFTGKAVNPLDIELTSIDLIDIAHALSNICRFTGHVRSFYSVAQHSVLVSQHTEDEMWGLLHDASEAYLCDVARPVKHQLPQYKAIEHSLMSRIARRYHLTEHMPADVKDVDNRMLVTERRDLLQPSTLRWTEDLEALAPYDFTIVPMPPTQARTLFLDRAQELGVCIQ